MCLARTCGDPAILFPAPCLQDAGVLLVSGAAYSLLSVAQVLGASDLETGTWNREILFESIMFIIPDCGVSGLLLISS